MIKILITGSAGQLGQALCHHPLASSFDVLACTHADMDITNPVSIHEKMEAFLPNVVINTAAYVAADKAEQEKEKAHRINHEGPAQLARACQQWNATLIHISTDYVFDGIQNFPYDENIPPHPLNVYGESKYLSEETVKRYCEKHLILRVSAVFSEYGQNFFKTILRLAKEKKELRIVADQITCPTSAVDIAQAIFTLAAQPISAWGIYHYASTHPVSWYQFAKAIIEEARRYQTLAVEEIIGIPACDYPVLAKRPAYSVLDCTKIKKTFNISQPAWESAIQAPHLYVGDKLSISS